VYTTIISVDELATLLADDKSKTVILDCRFDLANPDKGRSQYAAGHIPSAIYADLNRDLSAPHVAGETGRHPLPAVDTFAAWLSSSGVGDGVQVVAYDGSGGSYAARLWWMLRWLGHDAVAVLDGGWNAWMEAGGATDSAWPTPTPGVFHANPRPQMVAEAAEVASVIESGSHILLDARTVDRFRGENETIDPVGGHIPTARNAAWAGNLGSDGRLLPAQALRARFATILPADAVESGAVIAYCGSGVTAAHNLLALEVAGISGARLYPGSWSEWITDPARPVAVGE